jgi:hypothetical protein
VTVLVEVVDQPQNFTNTESFKQEYLEGKCKGCGSRSHSLLERIRSRTRSDIGTFKYTCPRVKYADPMEPGTGDQIRISFNIDAQKYAEDCNFNKEVAQCLLPELDTCRSPTYSPVILTRFKDRVLNICQMETDRLIEESKAARREGFVRVFLTKPCRLCGSEDHHMLREVEQEDGSVTKHFNCPIAAYSDEDLLRGLPGTKIYRICPAKLAEISGFSHEGVNGNLNKILEKGYGRFLSNNKIFQIRDLAYQACDQERGNWQFKREQPTDQGKESEDGED